MLKFLLLLISFSISSEAKEFTFDKESGKAIPKHVGELKVVRGVVYIKKDSGMVEAKEGARLQERDFIKTQAKSFARLVMVDDSIYFIGPDSEFNIANFKFKDKTDRKMVLDLIKGQIRGKIKHKAREGDINLKTRLITMGVRGTEFLVNQNNENGFEISEVALLEGNVELVDRKNQSYDIKLNEREVFIQSPSGDEAREKILFSENERNQFKDEEALMPFFKLDAVSESSSLNSLIKHFPAVQKDNSQKPIRSKEEQRPSWKENLKKLNEKLREYRK